MAEKLCSFESCDKPIEAKGLCKGHYYQLRRGQELRPLRKKISKAEAERLRARGLKRCPECDQVKPLENFAKNKSRKDGRHHQCKACLAEYREANRERRLEYNRQWYGANREQRLEYNRQWREANPEYNRQWAKDNPEKRRANRARRRARKRQATTEPFTVEDQVRIWGENPVCVYCRERPAEHLDHFVPLALGGEHSLTNATWPACAPCNLRKRDKHPYLFLFEQMNEEEQAAFVKALEARMANEETSRIRHLTRVELSAKIKTTTPNAGISPKIR